MTRLGNSSLESPTNSIDDYMQALQQEHEGVFVTTLSTGQNLTKNMACSINRSPTMNGCSKTENGSAIMTFLLKPPMQVARAHSSQILIHCMPVAQQEGSALDAQPWRQNIFVPQPGLRAIH